MVGWHHWLNRHEFEQTPEDGGGQGSQVGCSPWGCQESDTAERLNSNSESGEGGVLHLVAAGSDVCKNLRKRSLVSSLELPGGASGSSAGEH